MADSPSMPRRTRLAVAVAVALVGVASLALAACGGGSKAPPPTTVAATTTTTTTIPPIALVVAPESAPSGSAIALSLTNATPGASILFTILRPDGKTFTGTPKVVAADGTVAASYISAGDPIGVYTVSANGDAGVVASGAFTLTQAVPGVGVTAAPTVKPATTTAKPATTTVKPAVTTAKPAVTAAPR
jgi:hypothetical protein